MARKRAVKDMVLGEGMSVDALMRQWKESGGFTGRKVADATDIVEKMERQDCTVFLSFPACIMATGTRGVLVEMVKRKLVDVIVTTCGTLDHDLARTWKKYYHGDFNMDDAVLHQKGVNRLGNVLVPNESYGIVLERKLIPMFGQILKGRSSISTRELIDQVGARVDDGGSLLHWCHRNHVPVYVPGITDGSFGSQLWMYYQTHRDLRIDLLQDEQELSDLTFDAKGTGAIIVGGGISKHHTIWWNQFRGGLDYAVYLTTAPEYDGSLSGAQVREAVSWGKVKEGADQIVVEGDATITLPIIVASLISRLEGRE
jgi:deoxyhypusine synthase